MPDYPDQKIIEQALAGSVAAFRTLVEKHQPFVYRVAYRIVGTADDAEDITQEAFIRLWKNLSRYRPEIRLTTWLYKIVTNLCLDFLRSKRNRTMKSTIGIETQAEMCSHLSADQPLIDGELHTIVARLTSELSPKQKAVFVLRDLEEVSMPEIAEILAMDTGQVKSNLYYARKRMSEMISAYYQIKQGTKP